MTQDDHNDRNRARSASHIWSDAKHMMVLRRQLFEAEIQSDLATVKRFGCLAACGLTLSLCGVFLLVVMLVGLLDGWMDRSRVPWATLSLGIVTLVSGLGMVVSAWNGVRRELLCFRESRSEIQEDLFWMREWVDGQLAEAAQESRA